jgi:hypothetical protein
VRGAPGALVGGEVNLDRPGIGQRLISPMSSKRNRYPLIKPQEEDHRSGPIINAS